MPTVSIGMPVYNDRRFLAASVESLLRQTFSDFELILRDDGSTDGSAELCASYTARDPRVRFFRNEQNLGISRTMQRLLTDGRGEFFMWAGDDDMWHEAYVEKLVDALRSAPDCVAAFTPYAFIDEEGKRISSMPVRAVDYGASTALARVAKLAWYWDDGFGYGLFRRESITNVRFPVWWSVNRDRAYNNIYPTLYHYLSRGNFKLVGVGAALAESSKETAASQGAV